MTAPPVAARPWGQNYWGALARGGLWSALGLVAAHIFFSGEAPVVAVVLVALGQADFVESLLDRNREEVYGGQMRARHANLRMARELFGLFLGIFLAYSVAVSMVGADRLLAVFGQFLGDFQGTRLHEVDFGTFGYLMGRNGAVLIASFLISTLYLHGGILLVLAWNAARWGVVLGYVARTEVAAGGLGGALSVTIVLPHLAFEAVAYVLAAMAGAFLGRLVVRHRFGTATFNAVGVAILTLLLFSVTALAVASAFESRLNPILRGEQP